MKVVRACKRNACLRSIAPDCVSQPCPALGRKWQWYFTRNVEGAHVGAPQGLQRLIDLVCEFCVFMGMVVSVVKTKVMVFNLAFPGPFQWTCGGEQLEIVIRHARSLLDIPVSAASMKRLLRFRMGCHRLPRDEGSWAKPEVPRLDRVCQLCGAGTLGDERHLVFECPGMLCFREQWSHLFEGPQTMQAFMWQEDLIGIVRFINACLHKMMGQTSDQPGVAGRDVI